jgi:glucose/arabinose dehydrogenase
MKHLLRTLTQILRSDRVRPGTRPGRRSGRPRLELLEDRVVPTTLPPGFEETLVAGGLGSPTAMTSAPDGRVFIATQGGDLRVVKNGALLAAPFLHLNVDSTGERGLLGVAFDPNFNTNHFLYVYYTVPGSGVHNRVSRFTADPANPDVAAAGSEQDLLDLNPLSSATNHNGGSMHFGIDGDLYVGVGENANPANSQTLGNLLGKVLRLDVAQVAASDPANSPKLIPADNPFVGQAAGINQLIFALGFRNPFTFGVQPGTGVIFIDDVGQSTWEEIDKLVPGGNFGWNLSEGFATTVPPTGLGPGTYQDPQLAYNHSGGPAGGGIAIVGGAFYNPPADAAHPFPASYTGKYFYADLGGDWIRAFDPANPGSRSNPDTSAGFATGTVGNPVGVAVAADGGLYYLAQGNGGELLKISFTQTLDNTTFVHNLYHDLLNRAPDPQGSSQWVSMLNGGTSRQLVSMFFWRSDEHRQLEVNADYQNILGRAPDGPGNSAFMAMLRAGATELSVEQTFLNSAEFRNNHLDNTNFVDAVYSLVLNRAPGQGEETFWINQINTAGIPSVVSNIVNSDESYRLIATKDYMTYLNRTADAAGRDFWANQLRANGARIELIAEDFLASAEYFALPAK